MRFTHLIAALLCGVPALAQNWYIPDNVATTGTCNVIPFGQAVGGSFYNTKYQTKCTVADLGGLPNVITGLAFAPCTAGRAHYDQLEIVIDHHPAGALLVNTFASNLTANAVTVLSSTNYTWNVPANVWYEVGLQVPFVYNGVDDIVIQITSTNGNAPGGFHRGTRQRLQWAGAVGPPPANGSLDAASSKIEVSMSTAHTSTYGDGCLGSNGTPRLGFNGTAQLGTNLDVTLTNGVPFLPALFILGTLNVSPPFPLDLGFLGAPGCNLYIDLAATAGVGLDAAGSGVLTLGIPAALPPGILLYAQWAPFDPAANPFNFTTSTYGRMLIGL